MPLADTLLDWFTSRSLTIGLGRGGQELEPVNGYERFSVPSGGWVVGDGSVTTLGRWMFTAPVIFDQALIMNGDETVQAVPMTGLVSLPAMTQWEQEVMVVIVDG